MTKSSSTSLHSLLEETNTFDNSLPKSETFFFDLREISSGSTTTGSDISLLEYEAFYDDHVKEIGSGSATTHFDSSLYDSFIFDLSINPFPPADRSDFYKFANELAHIVSPPEYDCFTFKKEPNAGDFTMDMVEDFSNKRTKRMKIPFLIPASAVIISLLSCRMFCMSSIPGNLMTHAEGFCPPVFISSASLRNHVSKSDRANVYLMDRINSYKAPPEETAKDKGLAGEVSASTKKNGKTMAITTEAMQKRKNDEAILKTFGGNEATKKIKKNQLKQQYGNFKAEGLETLEQTFNRLQAIRNKDDLDIMSLDDVYNHLKIYKLEVQKRAGSNSQNMAFIYSSNTSSGKSKVPNVQGVSTASAQVSIDSIDIDDDDIEKMDIKWNLALLSMRADRSPRSQDRGKRESYKKDLKVEEPAPKEMIAIDGIGWDWSYMDEEDEASKNHALVADEEEVPTEYDLMAKSSSSSDNEVKKEKESIDFQIEKFKNASKDIDRLLGSQKLDNGKKGVGFNEYCVVPPPPTQVYSPSTKDLSWMGLPKFVDDTVTDYTRPTPSIDVSKSISKELEERWKSNHPSFFEQEGSSGNVVSKPMIKFVKESGCPNATKVNNTENARKPTGMPQDNIDDKEYWDSGCSRHMTGNISYLSEYEPFNRGYVSFGHGRGKITGKGLIKIDESMLWHRRLGHLNFKTMNKLVRSNLVKGLPSKSFENDHSCVACLKGKQHKASFMIDDFSRFSWTFFFKSKDETSRILRNFIAEIENLKELNVKIIKSDNEGEFRNKEMDEFCSRKCIKREFSNARTLQQNGVAERRNRTLIEAARTMLVDAKLPITFWAKAVNTACYVQNRVLVIKPHNKTPYELFNERSPAIGFLRPFGCHVMILNTLDHLGKFDAKGDEGYFVGYSLSSKAFRVSMRHKWQLQISGNSNPTTSTKVSTNDSFELSTSSTVETEVPTVSTHVPTGSISVPPVTFSVPRIISRGGSSYPEPLSLGNVMSFENRLKDFFGDTYDAISLNDVEANLSNMETAIQVNPTSSLRIHKDHPKSQIIGPIDTHVQTRQKTKNVDEQSFIAIIHQKTNPDLLQSWLTVLKRVRPIGTKWVLKNKKDERGIVIRNKARLVAQGDTQEKGIDYKEVFVHVARIEAIRLFPAYASYMGFTVYLMDVKSAFLYGTINEEVYVMQPPGFQDLEFPHKVYKVEKAIEFKALMHDKYQMSVMSELNLFLGLQVLQKKDGIFLSQDKYVGDILQKFGYTDIRSANTPMNRENPWGKDGTDDNVADLLTKAFDVGRLQYLVGDDSGNSTNGLNRDPVGRNNGWRKKILAKVNGRQRTFSESSIRRHLKLNDKEVPSPEANETAFPTRDARYGEAFPTVTSLDAGQDKENIAKTSAMPHEASLRVTSLGGVRAGVDQREDLLVGDTVKDSDKSADKGSDSIDDMANVLGTLGATNILASGGLRSVFNTARLSVSTASTVVSQAVATASGSFPTAAIFTTASVTTPTTRVTRSLRGVVIESSSPISVNISSISKKDKGKGKMIKPEQPSKEKVIEQVSAQLARDLEAKFAQEDQIIREQAERDSEIAMIHAERELEMMIAELDRRNKIVAKYLSEYEQAEVELSHDEKLEIERLKRPKIQLGKESFKKLKSTEALGTKPTQEQQFEEPKELSEEELKKMMELVPVEELYIEALQVKYPIIDWEIYSEDQRKYWKIIRVRNHTEVYQIFDDMLKKFDKENLDRLWSLFKETCSTTEVIDEKEKEL
nr:hypothetical protein [Tanacetum cinerariifolium]